MEKKKKFTQTTVGKILGGTLGLINPVFGQVFNGVAGIEDVFESIKAADAPEADKVQARSIVLEAYEAEVNDRIGARQREAQVAASGGSDILFKTVGWGIVLCFIMVNVATFGLFGEIPEVHMRGFDRAYGAVTSMMVMVVSYYFGSSMSSNQKTHLMNKDK